MKKILEIIKRIFKCFFAIFFVFAIIFCLISFVATDIFKKDYANIFGYTSFVVASGSMTGTLEVNDIVFVKITKDVKINDIITFKNNEDKLITHRLIRNVGNSFVTKGDYNQVEDDVIQGEQIIGKVIYHVSLFTIAKIIILILVIYIFISLLNYDYLLKKYGKKSTMSKELLPDSIFKDPHREDEPSTGLTVTISIDEMEMIEKMHYEKNDDSIEILDLEGPSYEEMKKKEKQEYEKETIDLVVSVLKCKNKSKQKARMNKKWVEKYQYVYRLCLLSQKNDSNSIIQEIQNPSFSEVYDYDLEKIGLTMTLRNRIYNMPIYVYLNILMHCALYNDLEFFDGVFKILKYRIIVRNEDKDVFFNMDKYSLEQLKDLIAFMQKIPDQFDNKDVFQLEKIERIVKIENY